MLEHDVKQFSSDKILKHLDRVNDWLQGRNPFPITMELDMTNACSHNCPECVAGSFERNTRDAFERPLAERVIRELAECKIRGLIFTGGGDPLNHPDTPEMIVLARGLGMDVALITNGSLLSERNMPVILKHCTWVRVSLDAITPPTYQSMHGMDEKAFQKVIANTKRLAEIKKDLGSACTVGVGFLTCEKTVGEMVEAARACKTWGVDYLQFRPVQIHRINNDACSFEYHWADVDAQINEACQYSDNGYQVLYSKHKYEAIKREDGGRTYGACYGQQFASTIAANAKVYICCHLRDFGRYCLGDLRQKSFKEIWNGGQRQEVIRRLDFRHCIPLCRDNTFNQVLWNIKQEREHVNFL